MGSGGGGGSAGGNSPIFNPRPPTTYYIAANAGEQAQTYFLDRQASTHRRLNRMGDNRNSSSNNNNNNRNNNNSYNNESGNNSIGSPRGATPRIVNRNTPIIDIQRTLSGDLSALARKPLLYKSTGDSGGHYGSINNSDRPEDLYTIRFQVVVWNIGKLDIVSASVPMTFRVTLFWNDVDTDAIRDDLTEDGSMVSSSRSINVWRMHGRQKAVQQEIASESVQQQMLEVPPLAIMNCSTFATIGTPEVDMLRESSRLMRWSCMYRATMIQENLRVDQFPHDDHDIYIQLAILSHRGKGKQWDRRLWKLGLATPDDAQDSTRVSYGVLVDQARLPGFSYNKERGLDFNFVQMDHGAFDNHVEESSEEYLRVSLHVLRESGYYDNNIVPLLALMNVVAVSVLTFKDTEFFYRGLITLNIAFVEMSIRMTADSHLPSVGYEIRLQSVLNQFFFVLMGLVLEAMIVNVLRTDFDVSADITRMVDVATGALAIIHNFYTVSSYYESARRARRRLNGKEKSANANRKRARKADKFGGP
ncbi:MAG: hypothetical protein SGBAC_004950 [Bacillariaceae sp.]